MYIGLVHDTQHMHGHFYNNYYNYNYELYADSYFFVLLYRGTMNDFPPIGKKDFSP